MSNNAVSTREHPYPKEFHKTLFIVNDTYENFKKDDIGKYLELSWGKDYIIKIRTSNEKALNYFDELVLALLIQLVIDKKEENYFVDNTDENGKIINTKWWRIGEITTYYELANNLQIKQAGQNYDAIKTALKKLNNIKITMESTKDKLEFYDLGNLVDWHTIKRNENSTTDKAMKIVYRLNPLITKNIVKTFGKMFNYMLLDFNKLINFKNKIAIILYPQILALMFDKRNKYTVADLCKNVYGFSDESFKKLEKYNRTRYLNNTTKALKEIIEVMDNQIEFEKGTLRGKDQIKFN